MPNYYRHSAGDGFGGGEFPRFISGFGPNLSHPPPDLSAGPPHQSFSGESSGYYPRSPHSAMSHGSRNRPLAVSLNHAKRNLSENERDKSQKVGRHN